MRKRDYRLREEDIETIVEEVYNAYIPDDRASFEVEIQNEEEDIFIRISGEIEVETDENWYDRDVPPEVYMTFFDLNYSVEEAFDFEGDSPVDCHLVGDDCIWDDVRRAINNNL